MDRRGLKLPRRPATEQLTFRQYVDKVRPGYRWYKHCQVLAAVLQRVADGKAKRLMVFMPPRHGKSELVSRLFTAYWLYRFPHQWVGVNSYGAELAFTLSRAAREYYVRGGGPVRDGAAAVKHWETGRGGGMWAAGVGGPITGKGWHLGVIDDPIKNAEEASSEVTQVSHRGWYSSTFYTREEPTSEDDPDGALILIQTRWHEADLSGWLLEQETQGDEPEHWHVVSFPAIAEDAPPELPGTCTAEPDWRQPGEPLCPERRPLAKLLRIRATILEYFWSALFQQRPAPLSGDMFLVDRLGVVDALPVGCEFVRYWDKAGTEGGGAYSAGVLMGRSPEGVFYFVDVTRGQWSAGRRERTIRQTAELDGHGLTVWVEQEPGSGGKESAENTIKGLAGFDVRREPVTGDKVVRARPLAAQVEAGNVRILRGPWNRALLDELRLFPNGRYKDQVDASSGAFNKLALAPGPIVAVSNPLADRRWGT